MSRNFDRRITEATRLIVLESPNSMTYEQQDLAAVAELARARGIRTLCDNSFATPLNQSPIALGIDLVAHSATKYLNGHSDVVAGMLCGSETMLREVFKGPYMTFGVDPVAARCLAADPRPAHPGRAHGACCGDDGCGARLSSRRTRRYAASIIRMRATIRSLD